MTDIADIKPDTSLYSTRGDRLRAMAAVADAHDSGAVVQARHRKQDFSSWTIMSHPSIDSPTFFDYRIEPEPPKPRELWAVQMQCGLLQYDSSGRTVLYNKGTRHPPGWEAVRFVEQL